MRTCERVCVCACVYCVFVASTLRGDEYVEDE